MPLKRRKEYHSQLESEQKRPDRHANVRGDVSSALVRSRMLLTGPRFAILTAGMSCSSFLTYVAGGWLPVFFLRVHHMTTGQIAGYSAVAVGLGGSVGMLGIGALCDVLRKHTEHAELKTRNPHGHTTVVKSRPSIWCNHARLLMTC
jgi:hypothetical protein